MEKIKRNFATEPSLSDWHQIPVGVITKHLAVKPICFWRKIEGQKKQFQELLRMITMGIADLVEELETSSLKGLISCDSTLGIKLGPRSPTSYLGLLYKLSQMKVSYQEIIVYSWWRYGFINALFKSAEKME